MNALQLEQHFQAHIDALNLTPEQMEEAIGYIDEMFALARKVDRLLKGPVMPGDWTLTFLLAFLSKPFE